MKELATTSQDSMNRIAEIISELPTDIHNALIELFKQESEKLLFVLQVQVHAKNVASVLSAPSYTLPSSTSGGKVQHSSKKRFQFSRSSSAAPSPMTLASPETVESTLSINSPSPAGPKGKSRLICLTMRPSGKVRMHKVKSGPPPQIGKTWSIDEVKSLEICGPSLLSVSLNKQYFWQIDDALMKFEFLHVLLKFCKKAKKMPKLINFSEDTVSEELQVYKNREKTRDGDSDAAHDLDGDFLNLSPLEDGYFSLQTEKDGFGIDEILRDFKWQVGTDAAALEQRFNDELLALDAANLHAIIQAEEQSELVLDQIAGAVGELDKIDEWLSLYYNELLNMGKDIQYIENQNKGLQIQAINQKVLKQELESFLGRLELPDHIWSVLTDASLDTDSGIKSIEEAIEKIQQTLQVTFQEPLNEMAAVQEKFGQYSSAANSFFERLEGFLFEIIKVDSKFQQASRGVGPLLNVNFEVVDSLIPYRSLVFRMKEMNPREHSTLVNNYVDRLNKFYGSSVKDYFEYIRARVPRKTSEELSTYLFILHTKAGHLGHSGKSTSITSLVSKHKKTGSTDNITKGFDDENGNVPQPKALSRLKTKMAESMASMEPEERINPVEAFEGFFKSFNSILIKEQNFLVDYFLAPDLSKNDMVGDLESCRPLPKDLKTRRKAEEHVDIMFESTLPETILYIDAALRSDVTLAVGLLKILEKQCNLTISGLKVSECVPYLGKFLGALKSKLQTVFDRFVEDQIKAIEDTKLSLKTRTGVLPFIKIFTPFVRRIDAMVKDADDLNIRVKVNDAFNSVIKVIFSNLDLIAREDDPEAVDDKEQLNAHIITIVNMHHLTSELRGLKISSLEGNSKIAKTQYEFHLNAYIRTVIRKPLGKLLVFFEGMEELLKTKQPEEVPYHLNYNKTAIKKCLAEHLGKSLKKELEKLYERVHKHFGKEGGLLDVVWHGIQVQFLATHDHFESLIKRCYKETSDIHLQFTKDNLCEFFADISQSQRK